MKWLFFGILGGILLSAGVFLALRRFAVPGNVPERSLDPPTVVKEVQQLSSLISVRYVMQKVIGLEDKRIPLGSEKLLLFVQAEVLAGVDLQKLTNRSVRTDGGGTIEILLPPPRILHIVIDDNQTRVWDRRITWWTPWVSYNPDLERQARLAARETIEKGALEMGILGEATRNAETTIRGLLVRLGAKSVAFVLSE
ncbi:MAG: DUF4230 domain-containing protein [Rudaea sp.]